jgi:hypothetical protein
MNKKPDFGSDLAALSDNVAAEVGDVLKALREKKNATRPIITSKTQHDQEQSAVRVEKVMVAAVVEPPRIQRRTSRSQLKAASERDEVLENVTTRLRRQTNELLTEAALRQKLKKESPSTRQDIIEFALQEWFRKHGYRESARSDE